MQLSLLLSHPPFLSFDISIYNEGKTHIEYSMIILMILTYIFTYMRECVDLFLRLLHWSRRRSVANSLSLCNPSSKVFSPRPFFVVPLFFLVHRPKSLPVSLCLLCLFCLLSSLILRKITYFFILFLRLLPTGKQSILTLMV